MAPNPASAQDFEINRPRVDRFLVFHDITGEGHRTDGVGRFWSSLEGRKSEILRPHEEIGLDYSTMGIGIWSP